MFVFATVGVTAVYLLFIWLLSAAGAAWLADRKGYGERVGLFFGLLLSAVGFAIVLLLPGRPGSVWKLEGPLPNPGARRPLGLSAMGPAASARGSEAPGPALGDAPGPAQSDPPGPAQSDPPGPAQSDPPAPSEPPAGGDAA